MPMTREQVLQQDAALRAFQQRADDALSTWGVRAPAPVYSDDPRYGEQYRRDLAYLAKKRLPEGHELRKFQVRHISFDTFEVVEPQIFAACKATGTSNDSVPPGAMRTVESRDPQNGQRIINFYWPPVARRGLASTTHRPLVRPPSGHLWAFTGHPCKALFYVSRLEMKDFGLWPVALPTGVLIDQSILLSRMANLLFNISVAPRTNIGRIIGIAIPLLRIEWNVHHSAPVHISPPVQSL